MARTARPLLPPETLEITPDESALPSLTSAKPLRVDSPIHRALGISPNYTFRQFMKVVHQDKDLTNKLKAMKPLLRDIGIDLDLVDQKQQTNIIVHMSTPQTGQTPVTSRFEVVSPSKNHTESPQNEDNNDT